MSIEKMLVSRPDLDYYLQLRYSYRVLPESTGGFFVDFPDLPGCATHVDDAEQIDAMAAEIRELWIETEYAAGEIIPPPSHSA